MQRTKKGKEKEKEKPVFNPKLEEVEIFNELTIHANNLQQIIYDKNTKSKQKKEAQLSSAEIIPVINWLRIQKDKELNEINIDEAKAFLLTIKNLALRHKLLRIVYALETIHGSNDYQEFFVTNEKLLTALSKSPYGNLLKACGEQIMYEIDTIRLDPENKIPLPLLTDTADKATAAILNPQKPESIQGLATAAAQVGRYPNGKILANRLFITIGALLFIGGIVLACVNPPLGFLSIIAGTALITGAIAGTTVATIGFGVTALSIWRSKHTDEKVPSNEAQKRIDFYKNTKP